MYLKMKYGVENKSYVLQENSRNNPLLSVHAVYFKSLVSLVIYEKHLIKTTII